MALAPQPVAPDLADDYRRNPLTGLIDGIPPPHGTEEHEAYYQRRLDWLERKVRELRGGRVELAPEVSAEHRKQLQATAEGIERYLHLERKVRYHPPNRDGSLPAARSFRTHFPAMARMLDEWDALMPQLQETREALEKSVNAAAEVMTITHHGPFAHMVRNVIEHNGTLSWSHHDGFLWLEG